MKLFISILFVFMFTFFGISQGLYNNGAVITNSLASIYIAGNNGNVTVSSGALFQGQSYSITVMGNWVLSFW